MTIIAFWKEALQDNLVPGGSSFEVPFRPMGSLCSLSSVQVEEEVPELHLQWRLLSHSLEDVNEWLRRKRLVRVSAAWRGLADNHRAKRLIKKVCAQLHVQAIVRKAFAALLQHHRRVSARQLALLQVVDQWVEEKLLQQVVRSLRFWRSKAAKGSILRRGGLVLKRFLDASCVRKWLGTWISNVIRAKRISECMAILEKKLHITLRDKVLKAWHRVSRCTQAAQQVSEQKNSQRAQVALSRWVNTWRATRCRRLQLTSKCWQGFHAELHRRRCGVVVRSRCQDMEARAALLRWDMAISLRRKETALRQMIQVRELRLTVQRWQRLKASKAMEVKRLLGSTLRTWFTITGHLLFERQQREIETFGEGGLAGPTEWQSRQWRRGQRRCWNVWVQVVQKKRQTRRRIKEAKLSLNKLVAVQRLRFWHRYSRDSAVRKEQLKSASMALMARVSACRWARAHDCLVNWFTRTQARRIMCKETDLSGEIPLQPSFAVPAMDLAWKRPCPAVPGALWAHMADAPPSINGLGASVPSGVSGPSDILLMSDDDAGEVAEPTSSVCTTLAPLEPLCPKMKRWLKVAFLLWQHYELNNVATALPVLQWSWSLWRQSQLRAKVHPLRWWSLALQMHKLRELELRSDFRRLRRSLKAWYEAVAESLKEAVEAAQEELSTCRALFEDLHAGGDGTSLQDDYPSETVGILEPVCTTSKDLVKESRPGDVDLLLWAFSSWVVWARLAVG